MPTLSLIPTPRPTALPTPKCAPNCNSGRSGASITQDKTEFVENDYTGIIAVGLISGAVAVLMVVLVVWWLYMGCINSNNLPPGVEEVRHC
jgi:hypothetical protein